MATVDEKEDENDNQSNKTNDWGGFRKELTKYLTYIIVFSLVGGLFLVHAGGNLFLSREDLENIKKNNPDLFEVVNNIKSSPIGALNPEKAPYTKVGEDPDDDAFFSLKKWAFPYKNFFNKHEEWEFKKDNWDEAKPVLFTCGQVLERMFSGSYSTGRWITESLRSWGNKEAVKARALKGKSIMPTVLFWVMGLFVTLFLYYGIWIYALGSIVFYAILNFIFGAINIVNIPDPPAPPSEKNSKDTDSGQSGGAEGGDGMSPAQWAAAANAVNSVVDKSVDKTITAAADAAGPGAVAKGMGSMVEETGIGSGLSAIGETITSIGRQIKAGFIILFAALFWFIKRLLKIACVGLFTYVSAMIGSMVNSIWQPLMFIGWFIIGPLFNDGQRKLLSQYIQKQKWNIALLTYISILMACYNNLEDMHPEYMIIGGVIVLALILFGKIQ